MNQQGTVTMKNSEKDIQLSFDFDIPDRKIQFTVFRGRCRCGYSYEFRKADVVIEMTVPCPACGSVISIK
jgi:hypothetical protein